MELVLASLAAEDMLLALIRVKVLAARTGLGGSIGVDVVDSQSLSSRLVLEHLPQLSECPAVEIRTLLRVSSFTSFSNPFEIL